MNNKEYSEEDLLWMDTLYQEGKVENQDFINSKLAEEFGDLESKAKKEKIDQLNTLNTSPAYARLTTEERDHSRLSVEQAYEEKLKDFNARKEELNQIYEVHLENSVYGQFDLTREQAVNQLDEIYGKNTDFELEPESNTDLQGKDADKETEYSDYTDGDMGSTIDIEGSIDINDRIDDGDYQ